MINPFLVGDHRSGVYQIANLVNYKVYVGSAVDLRDRCQKHVSGLIAKRHPNRHLQHAWNLYGADSFAFIVLEHVDIDNLITAEQYWIDTQMELGEVYNLCPTAGSPLGRAQTPETKAKIGAAHRGKVISPEQRAQISAANKGRKRPPCTEETRVHMREGQLGKKLSEETKAKISEAHRGNQYAKGPHRKLSDETRARMSAAHKGKPKGPQTDEHRASISESLKRYNASRRIDTAEVSKSADVTHEAVVPVNEVL